MKSNRKKPDFTSDPRIVEHYSLLQDLGVLEQIDYLKGKVHSLENLIGDAVGIFTKNSIQDILEYTMEKVFSKIVPLSLTFILKENVHSQQSEIIYYRNLKKEDPGFTLETIKPFEQVFENYKGIISVEKFRKSCKDKEILTILDSLQAAYITTIRGFEGFYGLIIFGQKMVGQAYSPEELDYLQKLLRLTSISFQNSIHYLSAITDLKTGVYNYPYFKNRFSQELSRISRYKDEAVLIMLDIDHFKKLNDQYGHLAGDMVLTKLAALLKQYTRQSDLVCRFGGEEFIILLTETGYAEGWTVAERIRNAVMDMRIPFEKDVLSITISLGMRYINKGSMLPGQQLAGEADKALYHSKKEGRNRSTYYNK